jgi:hypothetical protein
VDCLRLFFKAPDRLNQAVHEKCYVCDVSVTMYNLPVARDPIGSETPDLFFGWARRCLDRPVGGRAWGRPTRRKALPADLPMAAIRRASSLAIWPEFRLDLETMHRRQRNCARLRKRFQTVEDRQAEFPREKRTKG